MKVSFLAHDCFPKLSIEETHFLPPTINATVTTLATGFSSADGMSFVPDRRGLERVRTRRRFEGVRSLARSGGLMVPYGCRLELVRTGGGLVRMGS